MLSVATAAETPAANRDSLLPVPRIEDAFDTGSPLRRRRIECGVSLRALSRVTGIPMTRLQRLEDPDKSGHKVEPRLRDIAKLAWALDVEPDDLIDPRWLKRCGLDRPTPREIWKVDPAGDRSRRSDPRRRSRPSGLAS